LSDAALVRYKKGTLNTLRYHNDKSIVHALLYHIKLQIVKLQYTNMLILETFLKCPLNQSWIYGMYVLFFLFMFFFSCIRSSFYIQVYLVNDYEFQLCAHR
jgi:uncharacterized membrane protein YagU involved in acid resistance